MKNDYVFDPEAPVEMARLITLDRTMTQAIGGMLVGVPEILVLENVLDLACGPGGWVLDMAFAYPDVEVAGVDISRIMIDYANARARSQHRTNASFGVMDITQPLDFPDGAFDLVNARFLVGVLRREQWPALIAECFRLVRPGGMVRFVESDGFVVSNSPSLARLQRQLMSSMLQLGYGFPTDGYTLAITPLIPHFLNRAGFQSISNFPFIFDMSQTSPYYLDGLHMSEIAYQQAMERHLLDGMTLKKGEDVGAVIQQMLIEMQQETFCALTYGLMVCAVKCDPFTRVRPDS
jgi:ubiquinone/menaquinone biosynthesis C-methylase UbiE